MSLRHANRTDATEAAIVAAVRGCHATWIKMHPPTGCDGIVIWRGRTAFVEVKDGSKPPSARKLTDNEQSLRATVELAGGDYLVWLSVDDALTWLNSAQKRLVTV